MAGSGAIPFLPEMLPKAEIEGVRVGVGRNDLASPYFYLYPHLQTVPIACQKPADKEPGKSKMQGSASKGREGREIGLRAKGPSWHIP